MAKSKERILAVQFRGEGKSIKSIAATLKVSTSTVSLWCKNVILTQDQILQLEIQGHDPNYGKRLAYTNKLRELKEMKISTIQKNALSLLGSMSERDIFIAGIALYWAEGFKKDNMVGFANSDPKIINLFIKWLIICLSVDAKDIKLCVGINIYQKSRTNEIEKYWAKSTNMNLSQFNKAFYQNVKWKKIYDKPNEYFGTLRVRVLKSTDLLRKINGLIAAIGKYE